MDLLTRFLNYASIPTFSNPNINASPSTKEQKVLAEILVKELKELGAITFYDEEHCYVYGLLKGNTQAPKIGFISHMDTSSDAKGSSIHPRIIPNYDGKDISLNQDIICKVADYPDLENHKGKTLITSDGSTLLGADDKAGIAEVMTMLEYFASSSDSFGDIYVCFTPDEEIGRGAAHFDFTKFLADFAYTVDGTCLGEISYENFNAADVEIKILGRACHFGYAKDKLVNALTIAHRFEQMVPGDRPENTEGYQGYYHLNSINGDYTSVTMDYIIRDFDKKNFLKRKETFQMIADTLNEKYGNCISLEIKDSYYNMRDIIEKNWHLVLKAREVMEDLGVMPIVEPVRGGTDGARLTFQGLPCPNLGTGGHNFHSIYEYVSLEDMTKVSEILIGIVKAYANQKEMQHLRK